MAGELGLRNSFRERVYEPLNAYRGNDTSGGRDISVLEFMRTRALNADGAAVGLRNTLGEQISMADVWRDLGVDPSRASLENLISLSGDIRYLAPELVRDFIVDGINAKPWWQRLCFNSVSVPSAAVVTPWVKFKDAGLVTTEEAETIAEAAVTWDKKTVTLEKRAKAIHLTDEFLLGTALPIIQPFLVEVGIEMAAAMNRAAVTTLVNGDQASGDECAIVGTGTGSSVVFKDFLNVWARGARIDRDWHAMVTGETMAAEVRDLTEFKDQKGVGGKIVTLEPVDDFVPTSMPHYVSGATALADDQVLLADARMAMLHLMFVPLRVETERIVMRQINGTVVSITDGFTTINRRARIIIDKNVAFSGQGFPEWMTPRD